MAYDNYCGNCRYHRYDKQYGDFCCTNPESERFAEFTLYEEECEEIKLKNDIPTETI